MYDVHSTVLGQRVQRTHWEDTDGGGTINTSPSDLAGPAGEAGQRAREGWDSAASREPIHTGSTPVEGMTSRLSILWIFATLNYLYCDVVTLMDPDKLKGFLSGAVGGMEIGQGFLLGAGILVEIPIMMALLSRVLGQRSTRVSNLVAGLIMTVVQLSTVFVGSPTPYYLFFSGIEIATTSIIVWYAWRWRGDDAARNPADGTRFAGLP